MQRAAGSERPPSVACETAGAQLAELAYCRPGPFAVEVVDGAWHDPGRDRKLGWRRYRPQGTGSAPVVVHSHGLGGSRASGVDWLAHWASWGIAGVAVQHPGSDADALASGSPLALRRLLRTAVDAGQLAARQHDLLFALDRIAEDAPPAIALSGHSFGAASALRLIGERRGRDDRPADPRIAAAVLFSPSARGGSRPLAERFAEVRLPCLHLTGTLDDGIGPGDIAAADRCLPYRHSHGSRQRLLVLDGAGHSDLAGQSLGGETHCQLLRTTSAAFFCAHLMGDTDAADFLDGILPKRLGPGDRLEGRG